MGSDTITVQLDGRISGVPGVTASAVVVVPDWTLGLNPGGNLMLVAGPLDAVRLSAVVHRAQPDASVTLRAAALAALTTAPVLQAARTALTQGLVTAAGFGVLILVMSLLLTAQARELTLASLATMGLRRWQAQLLLAAETLPPVVAAAIGGVACAWLLPTTSASGRTRPPIRNGNNCAVHRACMRRRAWRAEVCDVGSELGRVASWVSHHLIAEQRTDALVHPHAVADTPLTQRRLDEESGLLRDPARSDVARFAAPLDEFDARRRDGPLADRPDRGGGDATLAGARIDPVPHFGRARLSQAQADPAQLGGSGSILSYELRPATVIPPSDIRLLDVGRRIFEPVGGGNLHEAL